MKKRIKKYIDRKNFVKVHIVDKRAKEITNFSGIIFSQNNEFVLMCDFNDFNYDGFVVLSKSDISEIERTKRETFFDLILEREGIKKKVSKKLAALQFELGTYRQMFRKLEKQNVPIIIEELYQSDTQFQIGLIEAVKKEKVFINYIDAEGKYDPKIMPSKFKDITFFRIDSPYTNLFYKYALGS